MDLTPESIENIRQNVEDLLVKAGYSLPNEGYDQPGVITLEDATTEFQITISEV